MPSLDFIVTASWVGALALVLIARAAASWFKYRRAIRIARDAERLEAAMRPMASVSPLPRREARRPSPAAGLPAPAEPEVPILSQEEGA